MFSDDLLEDWQMTWFISQYTKIITSFSINTLNIHFRVWWDVHPCQNMLFFFFFKHTNTKILLTVSLLTSSNDPSAVLCTAGGGDRWSRQVSGGVQEVLRRSDRQRESRSPQQWDSPPARSHRKTCGLWGSQEAFLLSSALNTQVKLESRVETQESSASFAYMSFKSVFVFGV